MTTQPTSPTTQSRCIELDVDRKAARSARSFVRETLAIWGCEHLQEQLSLAVSELVTNAVIHAHSATKVTLVNHGNAVQLRVQDDLSDPPRPRQPSADETGGRGILMIEALCDAWGVDREPPGKTVWLDITKEG